VTLTEPEACLADRDDVARAIAFFGACDDAALLRKALADIAPKARRLVVRYLDAGGEEAVPRPADVPHTPIAASKDDALRILRETNDLSLLQAMTRAMGRRVEELQS
jgi:hypothetical protein